MNISSRHSHSNFVHSFDFHRLANFVGKIIWIRRYWLLFRVSYDVKFIFNLHLEENRWITIWWANFVAISTIKIYIYSNSKNKSHLENCRLWMPVNQKKTSLKFLTLHFAIFVTKKLKLTCHLEYLRVHFFWFKGWQLDTFNFAHRP